MDEDENITEMLRGKSRDRSNVLALAVQHRGGYV
jgi:hypothetical protein